MRQSKVLERLRKNEFALVTSAAFACHSGVTELIGLLGFDCIWIDMEHRPITERETFQLIQGARAGDVDTMVRIRKEGYLSCFRPLEDGATGIMVPHCMNADEARWAVRNVKFAPEGLRGFDNAGPDADYLTLPDDRYFDAANRETFVVVQIEDRQAVDAIDDIASVSGVDVLFVGPGDLTQSYGVRGQWAHPLVRKAIAQVASAASKHGRHWGIPVRSADAAMEYIEMGARLITCGSDVSLLKAGYARIKEDFDRLR
jgi:2-keto-3-deoxy-L-rhamnonate aldolase RhmA